MSSFIDALNQGVNNVTGTPLGQLGLQMLMASGPQQGNPGFGARLGQAFGGMSEMQRVQALQQYRDQMMQVQQQQMQMRQQAAQAETERQRQYQARLQDPNFLNSLSPMARQMAQLGVDPADLIRATNADNLAQHRQAQLAQQNAHFNEREARLGANAGPSAPRAPTPRQIIQEHLPDGRVQNHMYDAASGTYHPYGSPYSPFSNRGKAAAPGSLDAALDEMAPAHDVPTLPGTAPLSAYAPGQQQAPVGVLPMAAQGGGAAVKPAPTMRVPGQPKAASAQQYPGAPAVGTVKKGYRYNGGNPADPGSWSKV